MTVAKRHHPRCTDVVLHPGDFYFGGGQTRIRTLLGSCVAIVLWHPTRHIGGMCHFLLPTRGKPRPAQCPLDGHYADEAIELFLREIRSARTKPVDYVVKLFGGGRMFPDHSRDVACGDAICTDESRARCGDVACKNIYMAHLLLADQRMAITSEQAGGTGYRQVIFELWNGDVWVKRGKPMKSSAAGIKTKGARAES
jgi:chemotaxis protein CheD